MKEFGAAFQVSRRKHFKQLRCNYLNISLHKREINQSFHLVPFSLSVNGTRIGLHHYLHLSFLFYKRILGCWKIIVCIISSEKKRGEYSTQYKIYACWRQQELPVHILEKNLAPSHKSSSDHLGLLIENYCMQTHELWIDSYLIIRPPTLPVPLAAIQSCTMCRTIMIFPSDLSGMFQTIYGRLKRSTCNFTLMCQVDGKSRHATMLSELQFKWETQLHIKFMDEQWKLKAIISSFISAGIGIWHQIIKSSTIQKWTWEIYIGIREHCRVWEYVKPVEYFHNSKFYET